MLFNSFGFLVFLPVVFILYWFVFKGLRVQNLFVVAASYFFYGMWDWRFLALIFLTTLSSWGAGLAVDRCRGRRARMRVAVGANLLLNLGILAYFKYFNFFAENLQLLFSQFGYQLDWATLEILLPVGISFYTFQAVSYPIDVYRGQTGATRDFAAFMAFVSFFPQLVAGPIERSTQLLPQFLRPRVFDYAGAVEGMRRILWGFFKKIVIADNCAYMANQIFGAPETCNSSMLVLGALLFTFQIYGDFSGYSDIAIGTARLFGIRLMQNFHYPYLSRSLPEFWRRWHISLNKWFVDYVYIPLGGSRGGRARTCCNIMVVFFLSGLWHGAAWTFVAWGLYNGVILVAYRLCGAGRPATAVVARDSALPSARECAGVLLTFVLAMLGWVVFRADSLSEAGSYLAGMVSPSLFSAPAAGAFTLGTLLPAYTLLFIIVLCVAEYVQRRREFALDTRGIRRGWVRMAVYIAVAVCIVVFAGAQEAFIYFQF